MRGACPSPPSRWACGAGLPGPHLGAESLLDLASETEGVTFTAGVPTIWNAILEALDDQPTRWDLSRLRTLLVGGLGHVAGADRGLREVARRQRGPRAGA